MIKNRPDADQDRLQQFYIYLLKDDGTTINDQKYINHTVGAEEAFYFGGSLARYVKIEMPYRSTVPFSYLQLAEVEVYEVAGDWSSPDTWSITDQTSHVNVAFGKQTKVSSTHPILGASFALDGDFNTFFHSDSSPSVDEYFQVDLGQNYRVDRCVSVRYVYQCCVLLTHCTHTL